MKLSHFLLYFFCPLDAIDFCFCNHKQNQIAILRPFLFDIDAGSELIFDKKQQNTCPLLSSLPDLEDYFEEVYPSLTAKFLDLADSLEFQAYFVSNTEHGKVLTVDLTKICRKRRLYNNENSWFFYNKNLVQTKLKVYQ